MSSARLALLFALILLAAVLASPGARASRQPPRPPNVIFILADDLGWGDLGCYGHRQLRTPNLDRLARQGTLFTQFYVNGSVCSPTRTAFMTGCFPARHRIHSAVGQPQQNAAHGMPNWLDPAVPTLPRLLKAGGYRTAHFGKWHLGAGPGAPTPDVYGFDVHRTFNSSGPGWDDREPHFRARSTAHIVDEALRFIAANRARPFYLNLWTLVPHAVLDPTDEQMKPYENIGPLGVRHAGATQIYYASVTDLDAQVGRLLARLDQLGLSNDTLVLFSSDNGPEEILVRNASHSGVGSPGPFRGRKRSLYEGGVRVPFLARWPGRIAAGRVDHDSVLAAVDFLPSLCNLAGAGESLPAGLDGEDVSDVLQGKRRPRGAPLMWEWRFSIPGHVLNRSPVLAIREGRWKLLVNPDGSRTELYDIPADPSEGSNLADRHPDVVERLRRKVLAWQKSLPPGPYDPTAGKNDYPWPGGADGAR